MILIRLISDWFYWRVQRQWLSPVEPIVSRPSWRTRLARPIRVTFGWLDSLLWTTSPVAIFWDWLLCRNTNQLFRATSLPARFRLWRARRMDPSLFEVKVVWETDSDPQRIVELNIYNMAQLAQLVRRRDETLVVARALALSVATARNRVSENDEDDVDDCMAHDRGHICAIQVIHAIDHYLYGKHGLFPRRTRLKVLDQIRALASDLARVLVHDHPQEVSNHTIQAATCARQLVVVLDRFYEDSVSRAVVVSKTLTWSVRLAVEFIVWVLPPEHQIRYREEFWGELCDVAGGRFPRWKQILHTLGLLRRLYELRGELKHSPPHLPVTAKLES
jgi:hypothetical protein